MRVAERVAAQRLALDHVLVEHSSHPAVMSAAPTRATATPGAARSDPLVEHERRESDRDDRVERREHRDDAHEAACRREREEDVRADVAEADRHEGGQIEARRDAGVTPTTSTAPSAISKEDPRAVTTAHGTLSSAARSRKTK